MPSLDYDLYQVGGEYYISAGNDVMWLSDSLWGLVKTDYHCKYLHHECPGLVLRIMVSD